MFKECSIKWKVLGVALIGPLVIAVIMAWERLDDIHRGADRIARHTPGSSEVRLKFRLERRAVGGKRVCCRRRG